MHDQIMGRKIVQDTTKYVMLCHVMSCHVISYRDTTHMAVSSPSPRYLLVTLAAVMLKNANPDSVATALAKSVFPVPSKVI